MLCLLFFRHSGSVVHKEKGFGPCAAHARSGAKASGEPVCMCVWVDAMHNVHGPSVAVIILNLLESTLPNAD